MRYVVLAMSILAVSSVARAEVGCIGSDSDDCAWRTEDYVLQASVLTLQTIDTLQTQHGLRHGFAESNPLLGRHPSRSRVYGMALGAMAGHTLVSMLLPRDWRHAWQGSVIVVEIGFVGNNLCVQGGIHLSL